MVDDAAEVGYVDRVVDALYWGLDPVEAVGGRGDVEVTHQRWRVELDGGWRVESGEGMEVVGIGV